MRNEGYNRKLLRQAPPFLCHFSPAPSLGMVIITKQSGDRKVLCLEGFLFSARFFRFFPWWPLCFSSNTFANSVAFSSALLAMTFLETLFDVPVRSRLGGQHVGLARGTLSVVMGAEF